MRSAMRNAARGGRRRAWWRLTVAAVLAMAWLGLTGFVVADDAAEAASPAETMLTPWEGFVAVGGEPYGAAANPATLSWLDSHVVRAQHVSPQTALLPGARAYIYLEPDTGLGAGQLAYLAVDGGDRRVKQYVYSGSWRGGGTAVGFSVRHVTLENVTQPHETVTTWAADLGYRGQWAKWLAMGVVARNVLLMFGDVERSDMPIEIVAGLAFDIGGGLVAAADYIIADLEEPGHAGYRYGLEGRLGRVLARLGQQVDAAGAVVTYGGLGYVLDSFRLDATVGQGAHGRVLSFGLSMYF